MVKFSKKEKKNRFETGKGICEWISIKNAQGR
jgi:hypothetical protein